MIIMMCHKWLCSSTTCGISQYWCLYFGKSLRSIKFSKCLDKLTPKLHSFDCLTIEYHIQISLTIRIFCTFTYTISFVSKWSECFSKKIYSRGKNCQLSLVCLKYFSLYTDKISYIDKLFKYFVCRCITKLLLWNP